MKNFSIAHSITTGNYYISHKDDVNKWGLEKERVIYQSSIGYYYKIGKRKIYLTEEETETLNKLRNNVTQ